MSKLKVVSEHAAMKSMLGRIAITAADYFHAPAEECVADGVDTMADRIAELEEALKAYRSNAAHCENEHDCGAANDEKPCGACYNCERAREYDRAEAAEHELKEKEAELAEAKERSGEQVTELRQALCGNDRRLALLARKHGGEALSSAETDELDRLHQQVAAMFPRTPDVGALTARVAELEHHLSEVLLRLDYELDGFPRALEPAVAACKAAHKALNGKLTPENRTTALAARVLELEAALEGIAWSAGSNTAAILPSIQARAGEALAPTSPADVAMVRAAIGVAEAASSLRQYWDADTAERPVAFAIDAYIATKNAVGRG